MQDQQLARSISSIVGDDFVASNNDLVIDGLYPSLTVRPGSVEEVAACMSVCEKSGVPVVPAGRMSWLESGNPLRPIQLVLCLERLRRIVEYSPPDLTATVEAGLTLSDLNDVTFAERQWLPLDPPGLKTSSIGAIASCNSSGPLRLGFGAPRDYVIGMNLVHADGSSSKSGGKVAKNVAVYDMNKLYVGSYGTLAIITGVTLKLRPLPDAGSTLLITAKNKKDLFRLAYCMLGKELQPASLVIAWRLTEVERLCDCDSALLVRFIDNDAAVAAQVGFVKRLIEDENHLIELNKNEADALWFAVADLDQHTTRFKVSVPISQVAGQFESLLSAVPDCVAAVDVGTGIIRVGFDAGEENVVQSANSLRSSAVSMNGSMVIEKASLGVRRAVDSWGDPGSAGALMRQIKTTFDPKSLLNPGKFVLGL